MWINNLPLETDMYVRMCKLTPRLILVPPEAEEAVTSSEKEKTAAEAPLIGPKWDPASSTASGGANNPASSASGAAKNAPGGVKIKYPRTWRLLRRPEAPPPGDEEAAAAAAAVGSTPSGLVEVLRITNEEMITMGKTELFNERGITQAEWDRWVPIHTYLLMLHNILVSRQQQQNPRCC